MPSTGRARGRTARHADGPAEHRVMIAVALPAAHVLTQKSDQVAPLAQSFLLFRAGRGRVRRGHQPVAGAVRAGQAQGGRPSPGGAAAAAGGPVLPDGPAGPAAADRRRARAGQQHRPDRGGRPDGGCDQAATRVGRRRRAWPRHRRRDRGRRRRWAAAGLGFTLVMPTGRDYLRDRAGVLSTLLARWSCSVWWAYALDKQDVRSAARRVLRFARNRT